MYKKIKRKTSNLKVNFIRRFFPKYIIKKYEKMLEIKEGKMAYKILSGTYKYHKNNYELNELLGKAALLQGDWENAKKYLKFIINVNPSLHNYIELATCYEKTGSIDECKKTIEKTVKKHSEKKDTLFKYAELLIEKRQWSSVMFLYQKMYEASMNIPLDHLINLSMLYQINGDYQNADTTFSYALENYEDEIKEDISGYRKMILFDNGKSRIEFYKKLEHVEQLMITFDSINMVWKNPPFSYKFISQKKVDIIAVRKKEKQTYQQDLSHENFIFATEIISKKYQDKVAYGFSLGAYNALYYASLINCRILSISPRLSIHPKHGRKNIMSKHEFKDNESLPYNEEATPVVVYDPKNKIDNAYIQNEVLKQYPNTILIEINYGGHGMAPHLLKMGQLKEFVESFLKGIIPRYNRKLRAHSHIYFRRLSAECFKRNKPRWALDLVNKSLNIVPNDLYTIKIKVNILIWMNKNEGAISFVTEKINEMPKKLQYRVLLIKTCIRLNKIDQAHKELTEARSEFGNKGILRKLSKEIDLIIL